MRKIIRYMVMVSFLAFLVINLSGCEQQKLDNSEIGYAIKDAAGDVENYHFKMIKESDSQTNSETGVPDNSDKAADDSDAASESETKKDDVAKSTSSKDKVVTTKVISDGAAWLTSNQAYGTRIDKVKGTKANKTEFMVNEEGSFMNENSSGWQSVVDPGPLLSNSISLTYSQAIDVVEQMNDVLVWKSAGFGSDGSVTITNQEAFETIGDLFRVSLVGTKKMEMTVTADAENRISLLRLKAYDAEDQLLNTTTLQYSNFNQQVMKQTPTDLVQQTEEKLK